MSYHETMKRSNILYLTLMAVFAGLVVAVFTLPQDVLNQNELYFLLAIAVMGWLWIQAYMDSMRGS
jgi:hypothetical protein